MVNGATSARPIITYSRRDRQRAQSARSNTLTIGTPSLRLASSSPEPEPASSSQVVSTRKASALRRGQSSSQKVSTLETHVKRSRDEGADSKGKGKAVDVALAERVNEPPKKRTRYDSAPAPQSSKKVKKDHSKQSMKSASHNAPPNRPMRRTRSTAARNQSPTPPVILSTIENPNHPTPMSPAKPGSIIEDAPLIDLDPRECTPTPPSTPPVFRSSLPGQRPILHSSLSFHPRSNFSNTSSPPSNSPLALSLSQSSPLSKTSNTLTRQTDDGSSNDAGALPTAAKSVLVPKPDPRSKRGLMVRDLSDLFEAHTSTSAGSPNALPSKSSTTSARPRMLRRSSTLPEIDRGSGHISHLPPPRLPVARTPSLQSILSSDNEISSPRHSPKHKTPPPESDTGSKPTTSLASGASVLASLRPTIKTYSSSRSYLVVLPPNPLTDSDSINGESQSQSQTQSQDMELGLGDLHRESYSSLRRRYHVDMSSDDGMDVDNVGGDVDRHHGEERGDGLEGPVDLKTIGELRDRGENRRFLDEMGYLLEGLGEGMSKGMKRLSAMKLLSNMCEVDFVRKAKATDALGTAWNALWTANDGVGDKILDVSLVLFAGLATREPRHAAGLAQQAPELDKVLAAVLEWTVDSDPLGFESDVSLENSQSRVEQARQLGIGRQERTLIAQLKDLVREADLLPLDIPITTRAIIFRIIMALPPLADMLVLLDPLLSVILTEMAGLRSRIDAYVTGLPIFPEERKYETPELRQINHGLRFMERLLLLDSNTSTVVQDALGSKRAELTSGLVVTILVCQVISRDEKWHDLALDCLISVLRILVTLAESDAKWSQSIIDEPLAFPSILHLVASYQHGSSPKSPLLDNDLTTNEAPLTPTIPSSPVSLSSQAQRQPETDANNLDIFCLALALVTSLVQDHPAARDQVRQTQLDPSCKLARACIRACHCPQRVSATDCITGLYLDMTERSQSLNEHEAAFLKGHLAVLLGLLSEHSPLNREAILFLLPGTSQIAKLDAWTETIEEFVSLYTGLAKHFARALRDAQPVHDEESPDDLDEVDEHPSQAAGGEIFLQDTQAGEKGVALAERVVSFLKRMKEET